MNARRPPAPPARLQCGGPAHKNPAARRRLSKTLKTSPSADISGLRAGPMARLASETRPRAQCADDGDTYREIVRQIVCEAR